MRPRLVIWTVLGLAAAGCGGDPRAFTASDRAAIEGIIAAQRDAWNRGDLDGFMVGYARRPDVVFTSGGRIRTGWDTTLSYYRARYGSRPAEMGRLDLHVLDVHATGADGAVVLGDWKLTGIANAGEGVFTLVMERLPDGWRIIHDHTSAAPDPAPPDAAPPAAQSVQPAGEPVELPDTE